MTNESKSINFCLMQRLRFIDTLLACYGHVGRSELIMYFDIGSATASRDFVEYYKLVPDNCIYNQKTKRYIRTHIFKPISFKLDDHVPL